MINYTIIIPHKNIPDLLYRCIKSIPCRKDIQVIIVDDNSNIPINQTIIYNYNPNIDIYYTKEGKGAGFARNVGLNYAKGKWILFADADDYFDEKAFNILDNYLPFKYDLVFFSSKSVISETLQEQKARISVVNEAIKCNDISYLRYRNYVPWGKLYKRDFIVKNEITFDETFASNDAMFSVKCGFYAKSISLSTECIYVSTIRKNSLYYGISQERCDARMLVSSRINKFIKDNCINSSYRWNKFPIVLSYRNISTKQTFQVFWSFLKEENSLLDIFEYIVFKCKINNYPSLT